MIPMTNLIGSHQADLLPVVADAIRSVSPKSREIPILPSSLLLEELALVSLYLVAVILEVQDRFQVDIDPDEIPSMRCVQDLLVGVTNRLDLAA
jgi:acyl carrier protein